MSCDSLNISYFNVAELCFSIAAPSAFQMERLLPSFSDFVLESAPRVIDFSLAYDFGLHLPGRLKVLVEERNDMGHTLVYKSFGRIYIVMNVGTSSGLMCIDGNYASGTFRIDPSAPQRDVILSSMLRCLFAQNILIHNGISMHASCVLRQGYAYLFMGPSGTGKSTHANLWLKEFQGSELLNDDNPAIRVFGEKVIAFGTPWSGKTPCYRNICAPVKAIVRLSQAPENVFEEKREVSAFTEIYPGCSVLRIDHELHDFLCDNLSEIIPLVKVGHLKCRPDSDAARCCSAGLE